ncbi:MAG TPA: ABC transporter permease [Anaerolineales bacterium]|nr:ABC transporter permease [Anaerolineales bacterium]
MRNVWIIAGREFRHYFISPMAYVLAFLLYLILGGLFAINIYVGMQSGQISPDGRLVLGPMVTILIFTTPIVTMRLLAEEQSSGTIELLLTAPVRDGELVVGKWLGALGFMVALTAVTWVYPLILHRMTDPGIDQGTLVAAYLGLVLMVSAILAIGTLVSTFFRSSLAAAGVTLAVILLLWIIGGFASGVGGANEVTRYLSFVSHYYDNFYRGVIDLKDVVYYLSLTVLSLFLASQVLESRRWR